MAPNRCIIKFSLSNGNDLMKVDNYLRDHSYISGYTASDCDYLVFRTLNCEFSNVLYPNLCRWYKHVKCLLKESVPKRDKDISVKKFIKVKPFVSSVSLQQKHFKSNLCELPKKNLIRNLYTVMLEVKSKEDVDASNLVNIVNDIKIDGLKWGASKMSQIAPKVVKLSIFCTFDEELISVHDIMLKIRKYEDYVFNVDIGSFYKV